MTPPDVQVVGMGFAGVTAARVLAEGGYRVHLTERRDHIGGNANDHVDAAGVRVHRYGPHVFHTNAPRIFGFLSRFTAWRAYEHRVLAKVGDLLLPVPINRTTINALYGLALDDAGVAAHLARVREPRNECRTSEDVVLAGVGRDLCEKFFRGYSRKQWGLDLSELAPAVAARIPVRTSDDDRYFDDRYQCMPADGYTAMFERMLDHPRLTFATGVDGIAMRARIGARHVVHTGPIDAWYAHRYGELPYRSIEFRHEHLPDVARLQPVATINYPNDFDFTRVTEFKQLTGQVHPGTSIVREVPCATGEPFYPIPRPANQALYQRYRARADQDPDVTFVGRLAQYRYYNMDQAVAAAMSAAAHVVERLGPPCR
jgi:UDP-galactopyranose mutase